jgi:hypothetical protein
MIIVLLHSENMESLREDDRFIIGLQFARLYNSLGGNRRAHHRVVKDNKPSNIRDTLEHIFYHAAIVSESLKTIKKSNYMRWVEVPD